MNPNNPNHGGCAEPSLAKHVPAKVSVTSPDHQPANKALPGPKFMGGEPATREAKPKPEAHGFTY